MKDYEFTLMFALPNDQDDPAQCLDALFDAGCDDAVVGTGTPGSISLEFIREAQSAGEAVDSAISDVGKAVPGAELIEAKPDLVGLTDVAEILNCSRQNVRKYMVAYRGFPRPAYMGNSQLWHLWEVARFQKFSMPTAVAEIARATFKINLDIQRHRFEADT